MKKWLTQVVNALVSAALTTILTSLITGQPLTGLTQLKGLSQIFFKSSVPAWAFALILFVALLGILYFVTHFRRGRPKGKVHFVPDAHNCGWALNLNTQMEVRAGGTFTYDGIGTLTVLKAFLKGTQPTTDMMVLVVAPDGRAVPVPHLELPAHIPVQAFINLRLAPVLGTRGKPLRSRVMFRDKYNRDYPLERTDFPYIGQQ